jgi:Domain of unknown function (DUF4349)
MKKLGLILFFLLAACGKQGENAPAAPPQAMPADAVMPEMVQGKIAARVEGGAEQSLTQISEPNVDSAALRKYIALRHNLTVETPSEKMQASFDAAVKHCEALNCQILGANYNRETPYSPPSAYLGVRVPPRNVEIFLSGLASSGEITQHGRESEDKTNQVVDADARIKNLTEFRDQLRVMLSDKSAKFKDLIEVQRELVNTQSELDSITSMRKILAQETDLVAVNINFTATQGITEQGFFAPVARALKDAGRVMMESFAAVITFIMNALPWLLIGVPIFFLVRKYWVKIKEKF